MQWSPSVMPFLRSPSPAAPGEPSPDVECLLMRCPRGMTSTTAPPGAKSTLRLTTDLGQDCSGEGLGDVRCRYVPQVKRCLE